MKFHLTDLYSWAKHVNFVSESVLKDAVEILVSLADLAWPDAVSVWATC